MQEDEKRRLFLFRVLSSLFQHTELARDGKLCHALMTVAASPTLTSKDPTGSPDIRARLTQNGLSDVCLLR